MNDDIEEKPCINNPCGDGEEEEVENENEGVPECLHWTSEEVANWIEAMGFPYYRDCFISNYINGRRLILIDASALPKIGITDFEHIKFIAKNIRDLLTINFVNSDQSISYPHKDKMGLFLEQKCPTGHDADELTYWQFCKRFDILKFRPPLCNHFLLLPHTPSAYKSPPDCV